MIVSVLYGAVAITCSVQSSSKNTDRRLSFSQDKLQRIRVSALTLSNVLDVPGFYANGAVCVGGVIEQDDSMDVNRASSI